MRFLLALLALLTVAPAQAALLPIGGGASGAPSCPAGSPSPDGSVILPGSSCTLADVGGAQWAFEDSSNDDGYGNSFFKLNGSQFSAGAALEINQSGNIYWKLNVYYTGTAIWQRRSQGTGNWYQVVDGASPLPAKTFLNTTKGTSYQSSGDMLGAASAGDALEAQLMPTGIPFYYAAGVIAASNVTYTCDAGVNFTGGASSGEFVIGSATSGVTLSGCEASFNQATSGNGPYYGVNVQKGAAGFTATGLNTNNNDQGIVAGGTNGTLTLTNLVASHDGSCGAGSGTGFNHNVYLAYNNGTSVAPPDNGVVSINGTKSVDVICNGDPLKLRVSAGTITNFTVGCTGAYSDCAMNWPIDIACGGNWSLTHLVMERGPNTAALGGNYGVVSYGEEWPGNLGNDWNCPPNVTFTGDESAGTSAISNASSTSNVVVGAVISGTGIQANSAVASVAGSTINLTCSAPPCVTATATGASFTTTRNHTLVIDTAWMIDDGDSDVNHPSYAVRCGASGVSCSSRGFSVTVKNTKIIAAAFPGCGGSYLGPGVVDGGGNTCYASRAAAGLAAYPALPSPP